MVARVSMPVRAWISLAIYQANPHEAELIIAKNRDGEMGTVVCGFEGNHARFVNEPNPWQPPKKQEWHGYAD